VPRFDETTRSNATTIDGVLLEKLTQTRALGIRGFPHANEFNVEVQFPELSFRSLLLLRLCAILNGDMNEGFKSLWERVGGQENLTRLLRHFYADIRQHQLVGPIFNNQIEDWPTHLETIQSFWARMIGGPSRYSGQMPARHSACLGRTSFSGLAAIMGIQLPRPPQ
jgi:hypothetical protein